MTFYGLLGMINGVFTRHLLSEKEILFILLAAMLSDKIGTCQICRLSIHFRDSFMTSQLCLRQTLQTSICHATFLL